MSDPLDQQSSVIKRPPRLGDEVYNSIYGQLMSQLIHPGAKISIDNLGRELGVSQTPIREALSRLEAQGLVVKADRGGYNATAQMDLERFDNLRELRMLLEPITARKAALRITDEQLNELKLIARKMQGKSGRSGYGEFARLDQQFHDLIAQASGNLLIAEMLAKLHSHMHLFRLFHHQEATTESNAEHAVLIAALAEHQPDRAEAAMRAYRARLSPVQPVLYRLNPRRPRRAKSERKVAGLARVFLKRLARPQLPEWTKPCLASRPMPTSAAANTSSASQSDIAGSAERAHGSKSSLSTRAKTGWGARIRT